MKIIAEFDEKVVIETTTKYVMENLKHLTDPGFVAEVVKVAVAEVKRSLTIKIGDKLNIFWESL